MKFSSAHAAACLLQCGSLALASLIPPELSSYFSAKEELVPVLDGISITQPAQLIPTADTQSPPQIQIPAHLSSPSPYLLLMVDPDYNATVPTNVVLHTMVGNLSSGSTAGHPAALTTLTSADEALAAYIGPQPPPGKPSHNYTLMLFEQPHNFSIPPAFQSFLPLNLSNVYTRVNFPLVDFVRQTGLGSPVAATYFRLDLNATTTPSATNTTVSPSVSPVSPTSRASGPCMPYWKIAISGVLCAAVWLI